MNHLVEDIDKNVWSYSQCDSHDPRLEKLLKSWGSPTLYTSLRQAIREAKQYYILFKDDECCPASPVQYIHHKNGTVLTMGASEDLLCKKKKDDFNIEDLDYV